MISWRRSVLVCKQHLQGKEKTLSAALFKIIINSWKLLMLVKECGQNYLINSQKRHIMDFFQTLTLSPGPFMESDIQLLLTPYSVGRTSFVIAVKGLYTLFSDKNPCSTIFDWAEIKVMRLHNSLIWVGDIRVSSKFEWLREWWMSRWWFPKLKKIPRCPLQNNI